MFELFASEYGWTHDYILDNLTQAQLELYIDKMGVRRRRYYEGSGGAVEQEQTEIVPLEEMNRD